MKTTYCTILVACIMLAAQSISARADIQPWDAGESRMKDTKSCAKSRCNPRYDFSATKPHHHHGDRVIDGTSRHSWRCRFANER